MATSGSIDYAATRDDIITEALELLGTLPLGESPSAAELTSCGRTLNYMVKALQNRVKNLHVIQDIYLFTDTTSERYKLDGTTAHATTEYSQTSLDAAAAASATSLTVASITGFADGDNIGIKLADGTRHWDTINGTPSGTTIVLDTGLASAANDAASVVGYTTKAGVPHRFSQAYERNIAGGSFGVCTGSADPNNIDTPIRILNRQDYIDLSHKSASGRVNQIYPDYQRTFIWVYVWPVSSNVDSIVAFKAWRKIEDFDAASDDADFPQNWFSALSKQLAVELAPKYGYPVEQRQWLEARAAEAREDAETEEVEQSWYLKPDFSGNEYGH